MNIRTVRSPVNTKTAAATALALALLAGCESKPRNKGIELPDQPATSSAVDRISRARALADQAYQAHVAGKVEEAIRLNQQAIAEYPDFPAAWNNLGVLFMERDQNLEAVSAFQRAAELSPKDPRFPYNIGVIWWRLGYGEEAAKQFNLALERDPNYLPALRHSIQWDVRRGQATEETADRLRRALLLERDPKSREWLQRQQLLVSEELAKRPPVGLPSISPSAGHTPTTEVDPGRP